MPGTESLKRRAAGLTIRIDDALAAMNKRAPDFQERKIEIFGGHVQRRFTVAKCPALLTEEQTHDRLMPKLDALRMSG